MEEASQGQGAEGRFVVEHLAESAWGWQKAEGVGETESACAESGRVIARSDATNKVAESVVDSDGLEE